MKKLIFTAFGMAAILLVAELALHILPVPAGIALAPPSDAWQTRRLKPGATTMSFGWDMRHPVHGVVNESGFPASFPYRDNAHVGAVIGDSYVEGLSTGEGDRLTTAIGEAMGRRHDSIYNFGVSGASLPHYLGVARIIGPRYRLDWAVIVVTDHDFDEGFLKQQGIYNWSPGSSDPIAYDRLRPHNDLQALVADSALYRYVRMNLKFSLQNLFASGFEEVGMPHQCPKAALSVEDNHFLDRWIAQLAGALHLPRQKIVLVFDADRTPYQQFAIAGAACVDRDLLARRIVAEKARHAGYRVVDADPIFRSAWVQDHRPFDHAPLDRHWTGYTNNLIAEAIGDALGHQK